VWLTSAAHQECRDSFLLSPLFANHSLHPFPKSPGPPPSDDEGAMSEGEEDGEAAMQQYSPDEDEAVHTFLGHGREVYAAAWHPSAGDLVATGGADDRAFLWRVGQDAYEETQGEVKELSGHTDTVASLAFSHDGTLLATGGMDGLVMVWDASTGALVQRLEGPGDAVEWVRWHPRGNIVLAGSSDCGCWMWLAQTGVLMQCFLGHRGPVSAGAFSPDGRVVATGGGEGDCGVRLWNPKTGECLAALSQHDQHAGSITALSWAPDGAALLTASEDGTARVCSVQFAAQESGEGKPLPSGIRCVSILGGAGGSTSTSAAMAQRRGELNLEEVKGGLQEEVEAAGVEAALFLPALPGVIVTAALDGGLVMWDAASGGVRTACQHPAPITRCVAHPLLPLVVTAALDARLRVWDARTGRMLKELEGHTAAMQDLALDASGKWALTASEDGTARVFDVQDLRVGTIYSLAQLDGAPQLSLGGRTPAAGVISSPEAALASLDGVVLPQYRYCVSQGLGSKQLYSFGSWSDLCALEDASRTPARDRESRTRPAPDRLGSGSLLPTPSSSDAEDSDWTRDEERARAPFPKAPLSSLFPSRAADEDSTERGAAPPGPPPAPIRRPSLPLLPQLPVRSSLDTVLLSEWEDRAERGLLRYDVTSCPTRLLPGPCGFVAQSNPGRASHKRPTEFRVDCVAQAWDESKFHFLKARQAEVLFAFEPASKEGASRLEA
ncbi:hypothetical protein H632_c1024p0, partial [Helicosporidium sp. ATCC 50920]